MTTKHAPCPECGNAHAVFNPFKQNGRSYYHRNCDKCFYEARRIRERKDYHSQRHWQPPTVKQIENAAKCSPCSGCEFLEQCRVSVRVYGMVACEPGCELEAEFVEKYNGNFPHSVNWSMEVGND